ncbi:hypothetical protein [Actinoplanes sp. NPDC049802]|uniref:hypothetical protein n=1 Tax=Actinoplanes sp. NPDC049802 TaxID=3154742 RepID=UPI0033D01CE1
MRAAAWLRAPNGLPHGSRRAWPSPPADRWTLAAVCGLVAAASLAAAVLHLVGRPVHAPAAPLFARFAPHLGPGTPLAAGLAVAVVRWGPGLAGRLRWPRLLYLAWVASVAWTFSLALVDGWQRGVAGRLTTRFEYLSEVPGVTDVPAMLRGFTGRIVDGTADPWTTHVAGHPPGALLVFVGLDRLGLSGGGWAAVVCVLAGCLATVAVAVTLRALGDEAAARAAVPFLVLFPGAVWVGVSADGLFTGVAAVATALLAVGLTRPSRWAVVGGGAGLAGCAYLSYGLVLLALPALAVVVGARSSRSRAALCGQLGWAVLGAAIVAGGFSLLGFDWWGGYQAVQQRYYQGVAAERPYAYWIWANLAALALSAGPAAAVMLRHAVTTVWSARPPGLHRLPRPPGPRLLSRPALVRHPPAVVMCLAAAAAVIAADLSGLSKAEVERIWLPFAIWFPAAAVLLPAPDRRGWLCFQAGTALLVNHVVLTVW